MKARSLNLLMLVALGVALNIAVSWTAILLSSAEDWELTHPSHWGGDPPLGTDVALLAQHNERVSPGTRTARRGNAAWRLRAVAIDYASNDRLVWMDAARSHASVHVNWPKVVRIRAGWPIASFEGMIWVMTHHEPPSDRLEAVIRIGPDGLFRQESIKLLPMAPLVVGLLANSMLLGALAALPVLLGRTLLRRHRARRNRCTCCRYELLGIRSVVCPECGTPITTSRLLTTPLPLPRVPRPSGRVLLGAIALLVAGALLIYLLLPID